MTPTLAHNPRADVVDKHCAGLPPGQSRADPVDVPGRGDLRVELGVNLIGEP